MLVSSLVFVSGSDPTGSIKFYSGKDIISLGSTQNNSIDAKLHKSASSTIDLLFITASGNDVKVGIGTTNPKSFLDVRGNTGTEPADIVLRTSKPSDAKVASGDESGRISFIIESSSFIDGRTKSQFVRSGSSAEIFSRIIETGSSGGAYGNLIFSVNDDNGITAPIEALTIGHNAVGSVDGISLVISGAMKMAHSNPRLIFEDTTTGNQAVFIGGKSVPNANEGVLELYDNGTKTIQLDGGTGTISGSGEIISATGSFDLIEGGTF